VSPTVVTQCHHPQSSPIIITHLVAAGPLVIPVVTQALLLLLLLLLLLPLLPLLPRLLPACCC
jgi:hypothetical protein